MASSNPQIKNSGLIRRGTEYFDQNETTIILPGDSDSRASCAKLNGWRQKMFQNFHSLQSDMPSPVRKNARLNYHAA